MSNNDELTARERLEFDALPTEIAPSEDLEARVLVELKRRKLLARGGRWWRVPAPGVVAVGVAASLAAMILGIGIGRGSGQAELPRAAFILFLHAGPEFEPNTPENFPVRFSDYNAWVAETRDSGHFITGEQLDGSGRVVVPRSPEPVVETRVDAAPDGEMLGMFLINASDYEEATRIARSLPHLRYGGRVVVRRVEPV